MNKNTERFLYNNQSVNRKALEKAYEESDCYDVVYPNAFGHYPHEFPQVSGTCVLVKLNNRFFIITAQHTLKNVPRDKLVRPILKSTFLKRENRVEYDWLWIHGKHHAIELNSKILEDTDDDFPTDYEDLSIREVHLAIEQHDAFIDLDNEHVISRIKMLPDLKDNELVLVQGFPNKNFEFPDEENGLKIRMGLSQMAGEATIQDKEKVVSFKNTYEELLTDEDLDGISGGIVLSLSRSPENICWIGMVLRAGNSIVHYLSAKHIIRLLEVICRD